MLTAPATDVALQPARASAPDLVVLYGVFGLLLFGPLAFGAVEPWSIFILEAGAALLLVLWTIRQVASGELSVSWNPLFGPMLAFAFCIGLQLVTGRTEYRYETFSAALLYCAYGILCFLVVQVLRRTAQVQALTATFSVYGFLLASFALLQGLSSTTKLYWVRTPHNGGWIYGPYVNHNHYAGLMEMLVPIPLIFSLTHSARGPRKTMAGIAAALMASTIFLSGSRGGMFAFVAQLGGLAGILAWRQKSRAVTWALAPFLVIGVGLVLWLGGNELAQRLATLHTEARTELSGGTRLDIDRDALRMFARRPISGWGLGVFPDVYPQFRSFPSNFFINEAHNDYLQLLVEMGGLGFATMLWFLWALFRNAGRKLQHWSEDTNGAVVLAAMVGVTGILVHSLVDFNLQIPANAGLFYVFCVVAAMESRFGKTRRKSVHRVNRVEGIPGSDQSGSVQREGLQEPI
ncbi:MAG: O-antigen ligase family protein [Acidobacteriia bacterium]|nr:O-antigen ligase family protein [Terriglobia bacterium]